MCVCVCASVCVCVCVLQIMFIYEWAGSLLPPLLVDFHWHCLFVRAETARKLSEHLFLFTIAPQDYIK